MPRILKILPAKLMATAAFLAVLVAADPRISHLALCRDECSSTARAARPAVEPARGCCSTTPASRPDPADDGSAGCGCDCCHIVAGHRTERDARSTFVAPAPIKVDFATPPVMIATLVFNPPFLSAPSPALIEAGAGSRPCLLCNHLRT